MQGVEYIAEVVCWVVDAGHGIAAGIVIVVMFRSCIVTNGRRAVPLEQTTLIDENGI